MDARKLTYQILGRRLLTWFDSKVLVDWAVNLLKNGFNTESLLILAGLDYADTEEREKYFWKAVDELNLNIDINKSKNELINFYVESLTDEVLSGNVSATYGLKMMCEVVRETDYDPKYMQFYLLDDEIDYLNYDGHALFTPELIKINQEEYIINEFKLLKKISDGDYSAYYDKAICNDCGQIMKPRLITKYQFKKPFSYQVYVCEYCKSEKIDTFSSQIGREKIIEKLK